VTIPKDSHAFLYKNNRIETEQKPKHNRNESKRKQTQTKIKPNRNQKQTKSKPKHNQTKTRQKSPFKSSLNIFSKKLNTYKSKYQ